MELELERRRKAKERMKTERDKKEEERRKEKIRRKERFQKQKRLQEAWNNIRWITEYISENQDRWEIERLERDEETRRKRLEWEKADRFKKIEFLRERDRLKREGKLNQANQSWVWEDWRQDKEPKMLNQLIQLETEEDMWPSDRMSYTFT